MSRSDFEVLMQCARRHAARSPRMFRLRVTLRALCGMGSLFALAVGAVLALAWSLSPVFAGAAANSAGSLVFHLLAMLSAGVVLVACAWVLYGPAQPPQGIVLSRSAAPRLFALLDRMGRRFGTPPIHEVRVSGELNAAITQRPDPVLRVRLRNTLVLGLPLALAVTPRQLVAVLAHEFGHLRRQRIALGGWGCHARARWHQVLGNMESVPAWLQLVFAPLANRASPTYCAESLVLSHLDEFEADAAAAKVVGATRLGQALSEIALKHRFLFEDYWRNVYAQADYAKRSNFLPYRHMALAFRADIGHAGLPGESDETPEDAAFDTHPSLRARMRALGLDVAAPVESCGSDNAARRFLGETLVWLTGLLDRQWRDAERQD